MELVISRQGIETTFEPRKIEEYIKPEGILNSNYQIIAKSNLENIEANSVFGIRQQVKSYHYRTTSGVETLLKVAVFVILYLLIFY
ncbi:hypothetical protein [Yeosuana marina]|uniref:hypothetical protein n=1 Tax=Yeosuana marina TaxID=1565536 RepID=UPI0014225D25|nr:hypothetical protein [Yeosuana marina]